MGNENDMDWVFGRGGSCFWLFACLVGVIWCCLLLEPLRGMDRADPSFTVLRNEMFHAIDSLIGVFVATVTRHRSEHGFSDRRKNPPMVSVASLFFCCLER